MGGVDGVITPVWEMIFGGGDEPVPVSPDPYGMRQPAERSEADRKAEEKRRAAARKRGHSGNILTAGVALGEPQVKKKNLLGA